MKLILLSIGCGFLGMLAVLCLGIDGSHVNGSAVMAFGMVGFFCPGLYVLNNLYEKSKKENIEKENNI
ncbi:hypothetical protein LGK97_14085 [Clostridium sp. CS001]|uniref:hypothetical protein n=1 Tax=Clostridium sp. CS001 TaxID=2880648 RepID=UPI001CF0EDDF|nr:hypothetical protein [Clostridium sp. CS001]MCB2290872.1 hypothetical protein [Clostridium sp. CS001]